MKAHSVVRHVSLLRLWNRHPVGSTWVVLELLYLRSLLVEILERLAKVKELVSVACTRNSLSGSSNLEFELIFYVVDVAWHVIFVLLLILALIFLVHAYGLVRRTPVVYLRFFCLCRHPGLSDLIHSFRLHIFILGLSLA